MGPGQEDSSAERNLRRRPHQYVEDMCLAYFIQPSACAQRAGLKTAQVLLHGTSAEQVDLLGWQVAGDSVLPTVEGSRCSEHEILQV